MRSLQIFVVLALVPSLIARTESVSELLHNPQKGEAKLTFVDGTRSEGSIVRVTNQFVTFRRTPQSCENIELSKIAGIDWPSAGGSLRYAILTTLLWIVFGPLAVISSGESNNSGSPVDPILGAWESVKAQTPGRIEADDLEFSPGIPGPLSQVSGFVMRLSVASEKGTYRVESGRLHLSQLGNASEDVIPVSFDCDALIAASSVRIYRLKSIGDQPRRASAPIVGQWSESSQGSQTVWEFKPNGAYQTKTVERFGGGTFTKAKHGVIIAFRGGTKENWEAHLKRGRLYIFNAGTLTEYKKRPAYW